MELATGWCSHCKADVLFERPTCVDHPEDCPEVICTECCTAFVGGEVQSYPAAMRTTPARAVITPAA